MASKKTNVFYFPSHVLKKYEQKVVYFTKPRLVAIYDYNYGKVSQTENLKYFREPASDQYPIDLNLDLSSYRTRESAMYSINIDLSLKYDMSVAAEIDGIKNIDKTKVITHRGILVDIMECYYKKCNRRLDIHVSRYKGNLYMVREDTSMEELTPAKTHHRHLEKLLFSNSPYNSPKIIKPCDENIMQLGVHRSNFGKYDVIYSGEIQGIISDKKIKDIEDLNALNDCCFVFAKQMWERLKNRDEKFLTYWLQAYLANVLDIYIGYKTNSGIINEPIELKIVRDLPKNRYWKPSFCTGFLYEFLHNVEKCMSSVNCLNTVYIFRLNTTDKSFSCEIFNGKTDKTFITKEYMEFCTEI